MSTTRTPRSSSPLTLSGKSVLAVTAFGTAAWLTGPSAGHVPQRRTRQPRRGCWTRPSPPLKKRTTRGPNRESFEKPTLLRASKKG